MKRLFAWVLTLTLVLFCFAGCGEAVGEIAGNVAEAARAELEEQVKAKLEEYKVEVVELRTAFGDLNDDNDSNLQFFCAALVKSNSEAVPEGCADALDKLFETSGITPQTSSKVTSPYLVHKEISFNHADFSEGGYYTVFVYSSNITPTLPSIPATESN